jgi:hypothetical protein
LKDFSHKQAGEASTPEITPSIARQPDIPIEQASESTQRNDAAPVATGKKSLFSQKRQHPAERTSRRRFIKPWRRDSHKLGSA